MADEVIKKIPEGVSGLGKEYPSPEPGHTAGPSRGGRPMAGGSEFGSQPGAGSTWKRPSNYAKGGIVKGCKHYQSKVC